MVRFLDMVVESKTDGFDRLMQLFVAKQLPWLRDEMYADYLAEKGHLKVEVRNSSLHVCSLNLNSAFCEDATFLIYPSQV